MASSKKVELPLQRFAPKQIISINRSAVYYLYSKSSRTLRVILLDKFRWIKFAKKKHTNYESSEI